MRPLFHDYRKHAYLAIFGLAALSLFFALSPTGLVAFSYGNDLVDVAFGHEGVKAFAAAHPDFSVILEELTAEKITELHSDYPRLYTNLPDARLYQMILDAKGEALIVILNEDAVFKVLEVDA